MTYPTDWEYAPIFFTGDITAGLNKAGKDGWQFCYTTEEREAKDGKPAGIGMMMMRPRKLVIADPSAAPRDLTKGIVRL